MFKKKLNYVHVILNYETALLDNLWNLSCVDGYFMQ